METYETKYGIIHGISHESFYSNGSLKECVLNEKVQIPTDYGMLIPQYDYSDPRKKNIYCISFYESGALRKVALNDKTEIITSVGPVEAELITFYENGCIKKLFPLNGQLSAYWEEQDEYGMAEEMTFQFRFGKITAKVIAISFYQDGSVKDLTFWPKERIALDTSVGICKVRIGISLYPDGNLKSLEPASPVVVETPIGTITAYDKSAIGLSGENNSLKFRPDGSIQSLVSSFCQIIVTDQNQNQCSYKPIQELDVDGLEITFTPLLIEIGETSLVFNQEEEYKYDNYSFDLKPYFSKGKNPCSQCSSCTGCCLP